MALRRVLPSRANSAATQGGEAAPVAPQAAPAKEKEAIAPAPQKPADPTPTPETQQLAAAATSAFSTLPSKPSAAPRVLEESFKAPKIEMPVVEPAPVTETKPEPAEGGQPIRPEPEKEPEPQPAQPPVAELPVAPLEATGFGVAEEPTDIAPASQPAPLPEVPARAEPQPEPAATEVAAEPETEEQVPAEAAPARPSGGKMRRRVRDKKPRDFSAAKGPDTEPEKLKDEPKFAPRVPVSTQPLSKVDEKLISSGIIAPPPADSLTGNVPTGLAESESNLADLPPLELDEPIAEPVAAQPEPQAEPEPQPARPASQPVIEPLAKAAQPAQSAAAFNLSKTPEASEPLPPTQSDLPWTTPASNADWDIGLPEETPAWNHEGVQAETAAEPAQLPPPADVYRPQMAEPAVSNPPWAAGVGSSPAAGMRAASTLPPPELPSTPRRSGGGVPWAMVVVGLLLAGGAAYLVLRPSGGSGGFQDQMARLTGTLQDQPDVLPAAVSGSAISGLTKPGEGDLLPAPPSSFSGAPLPPVATAAETAATAAAASSTAVIDFADVTPEQAKQPIVADGTETMPEDLSMMAKFQREVMLARERKEAKEEGQIGSISATVAATKPEEPKADNGPYTEEKLQEELAAYRRALVDTPSPGNLKPAEFMKDPDGYMDGKPMQQAANAPSNTAVQTAGQDEAALLPPPELYTNNPKNLPVVAEPAANAPPRVRTLADFNVAPFTPERDKVEIPRGLKPHLAATDFPSLEVLSFVPNRGIVAYADGREGVLLIGETLNGWELVGVSSDRAEFKAGQKTYRVSADN